MKQTNQSDFLGKMDETLQLTGVVEYEKGDTSEAEFVAVDVLGNMAIRSSDQSRARRLTGQNLQRLLGGLIPSIRDQKISTMIWLKVLWR